MFTKRHEQELAEIKALTYELGERFDQVLAELETIKTAQDQLAANDESPATRGEETAPSVESATASAKRARRAQSATPVPVEASARRGKRPGRGGTDSTSNSPKQSSKRTKSAAAEDEAGGPGGRKRGRGRKRRQATEPAASPGSED